MLPILNNNARNIYYNTKYKIRITLFIRKVKGYTILWQFMI
jgi:hypothetical protein